MAVNLTITGFGACMIAGFPLSLETGFLHQAVQHLHRSGEFEVDFDIVAMGGFPVPRARTHLAKKVLANHPDIIVLQFGATDASAPLRNNFITRRRLHKTPHASETVSPLPPTPADLLKWRLRSLASDILRVPSLTPIEDYLQIMLEMAHECRLSGSRVVVVSPFVMGGWRSDRFADQYRRALAEPLARIPDIYYLDAYALLSRAPRPAMLLRDGFHLSARAHEMLGAELAKTLAQAARQRAPAAVSTVLAN